MFESLVAAIKSALTSWRREAAIVVSKLTKPLTGNTLVGAAAGAGRPKTELLAENALLRHQLIVLRRSAKRPVLRDRDRLLMVLLARLAGAWREAVFLVQPDTLLRWHRDLFKIVWRRKSRAKSRNPRISKETTALIRRLAVENVTWGAERIRGEFLKLGIRVSKRTIRKYIRGVREPRLKFPAFPVPLDS